MQRGGKTLICALCALALTTGARAIVDESGGAPVATENEKSPYSAIWLRNVFDLKPPPSAVIPPETNAPPPNVILTGITTLLGSKRALFLVQDPQIPGKPPTKEESFILSEGQRQGVLEVLEINSKAGTVKIKNEEIISTITFATNKTGGGLGGGPPTMPMGLPHQPRFNQPPGFNPNLNPAPLPNRMLRGGDASQFTTPGVAAQPVSPSGHQASYGMTSGGGAPGLFLPNPTPVQTPAAASSSVPQETLPSPVTTAIPAWQAPGTGSKGVPPPPSPAIESVPDLIIPPH